MKRFYIPLFSTILPIIIFLINLNNYIIKTTNTLIIKLQGAGIDKVSGVESTRDWWTIILLAFIYFFTYKIIKSQINNYSKKLKIDEQRRNVLLLVWEVAQHMGFLIIFIRVAYWLEINSHRFWDSLILIIVSVFIGELLRIKLVINSIINNLKDVN